MLTYGPTGASRGVATIIFGKPGDANNAAVQLNGMLVDKRPMKVIYKWPAVNKVTNTLPDRGRSRCQQARSGQSAERARRPAEGCCEAQASDREGYNQR